MKLVPAILLAVFTFLTVWGVMDTSTDIPALLKATGALGIIAFAFGYAVDILIFVILAKRTMGRRKESTKS